MFIILLICGDWIISLIFILRLIMKIVRKGYVLFVEGILYGIICYLKYVIGLFLFSSIFL